MKRCPNCKKKISFLINSSFKKIKCKSCKKVFNQTNRTQWINSLISVIPTILLIFPSFQQWTFINYKFTLILRCLLIVIFTLLINTINWPWNNYD